MTTFDKAVEALAAQRDKGIEKYGGELHETKPTPLELATHAKQEAADFLQYAVELEERLKPKRSHDFADATARFECVIHLASAVANECAPPETFEEFCEMHLPEDDNVALLDDLPALKAVLKDCLADPDVEYPDTDTVGYALLNVGGYLVQFAAPVREYHSETDCFYSWGYYSTEWRWFKTMEEAEQGLLDWAEAEKQRAIEKFKAKSQKSE